MSDIHTNSKAALRWLSDPDPATRTLWETPPARLSPRRKRMVRILQHLATAPVLGYPHVWRIETDREIMEALELPDMNCVRPRITEGIREGWIAEAGETVCPVTGMTVRAVRITRRGLAALREQEDE